MKIREIKKIEGMCVTKQALHYHTALPDDKAKEWYLDNFWAVSTKFCHESTKQLVRGNPYVD